MEIDYIFETHRNEDYTIGSLELKEIVGEIYSMETVLNLHMAIM